MSLINKMLTDLEARTAGPVERASTGVFSDLSPAFAAKQRSRTWLVRMLVASLVAASAFGWVVFLPSIDTNEPMAKHPATAPKSEHNPVSLAITSKAEPSPPAESEPPVTPKTMVHTTSTTIAAKPAESPPSASVQKTAALNKTEAVEEPIAAMVIKTTAATGKADETTTQPAVVMKKTVQLTAEERAENAYRLALRALQEGRKADATEQLQQALALNGTHVSARGTLVGLLLNDERWDAAQSLLQEGLEQFPNHPRFTHWLAQVYAHQNAPEKAIELLQQAFTAGARDPKLLAFMGALYQRMERYPEAAKAYGMALQQNPAEGKWWMGMALALEASEQWQAAKETYSRALASRNLERELVAYIQERQLVLARRNQP